MCNNVTDAKKSDGDRSSVAPAASLTLALLSLVMVKQDIHHNIYSGKEKSELYKNLHIGDFKRLTFNV